MTMAVGLIIHGDQAEQILHDKQADLIAVGREILNNPNWPMDAALKLGVEAPFRNVPPQFGYWLGTRAKRGFGTQPSTWQSGLNEAGEGGWEGERAGLGPSLSAMHARDGVPASSRRAQSVHPLFREIPSGVAIGW